MRRGACKGVCVMKNFGFGKRNKMKTKKQTENEEKVK